MRYTWPTLIIQLKYYLRHVAQIQVVLHSLQVLCLTTAWWYKCLRFAPWCCQHLSSVVTCYHGSWLGLGLSVCMFSVYVYVLVLYIHTVNGERFAGLNIRSFDPTEVFTEMLSRCLGQRCLLFSIVQVHIHVIFSLYECMIVVPYMWLNLRKAAFYAHNIKTHFLPSNNSCIHKLTIQYFK